MDSMGSKRDTLMKNSILIDEYIHLAVLRFSKYYINEEISHTKCHFSHSGLRIYKRKKES